MPFVTEIDKIRHKVLTEVTRLAWNDELHEKIMHIPDTICRDDGPRYRCCVHKERAVVKDRIKLALGQAADLSVTEAIDEALAGHTVVGPAVQVLEEACDRCPIDKFIVTDACRNCVAHYCINNCPKQAIMVIQGRAHIDHSRCVECGMCKKNCPFSAIVEVNRPCERACHVDAIHSGDNRKAKIDYEKCVQCGACAQACPFGAINDTAQIVQLITALRMKKRPVYALLAPSFVGQFGPAIKPGQVKAALLQLGFTDVQEASFGADMVAFEETKEFMATVPQQRDCLTTSCCPSFVHLIEKHFPDLKGNISTTVSPMIAAARELKRLHRDAMVAFIGPCVSKKAEANRTEVAGAVDFVLTFKELGDVFAGVGINLTQIQAVEFISQASNHGNSFARSGGLVQAVAGALAEMDAKQEFKPCTCDGLEQCISQLKLKQYNKLDVNFIEGMSCPGGCVGGPGTMMDSRVTTKLVNGFAQQSKMVTAPNNHAAVSSAEQVHMHKNQPASAEVVIHPEV